MNLNVFFPIIPIFLGCVFDLFLGDPYWLPHPVRLIGIWISKLEGFFRKYFKKRERLAGTLLAIIILIISSAVPWVLLVFGYSISLWIGIVIESIFCYYLLAAKCLQKESMKVCYALQKGDIEGARKAVSMIVGRDTEKLDREGIIKAAVETVAENTSDGVTAPLFYLWLGGVPLGFFYKAANTMDSMIGYKNERYFEFGRFAAKLDDLLNFIPSRITALFMIASAYLLRMDKKGAYRIWKRDRFNHESPNSAQTEAVCAGALGVKLAGDAWYFGKLHQKKTIGDAKRPVEAEDIERANRLMYMTSISMLFAFAALRIAFSFIIK